MKVMIAILNYIYMILPKRKMKCVMLIIYSQYEIVKIILVIRYLVNISKKYINNIK